MSQRVRDTVTDYPELRLIPTAMFRASVLKNVGKYYDLAEKAPNDVKRRNLLDFMERYARLYQMLK